MVCTRGIGAASCLCALVMFGCGSTTDNAGKSIDSCIQPPASSVVGEDKVAVEVAAKLAELPIDASLKTEFSKLLKAEFGALSDRNASLLLFLRAIECYLKLGIVGEEIARDLAKMVREEWSAQVGFRGKDGPLTPLEKAFIQKSSESSEILDLLGHFGVN